MTDPEITVIVPTRNRWPLLSRCALPSVRAQEDVDLELVVVDDGSRDETSARLAEISDHRMRVLHHDVALGQPVARNTGASVARGGWLAFLDDDDLWAPRKLRLQLDAATASGAGWVYARSVTVDASLRVLRDDPFPTPAELPELLLHGNWIPGGGSNVIVRSDLFRLAGRFDESLATVEDWDLWLRLLESGLPAACDELTIARMEHGENSIVRDWRKVKVAVERMMSKYRPVDDADRQGVAQWIAIEQYRAGKRLAAARMFVSIAVRHRSLGNVPVAAGVMFGDAGLQLASRLLLKTRGVSHVEPLITPTGTPHEPDWLARYR
jgi:glycosyltransferase involved in cell wall biosynthesis